jgi:hypothetical protein
LSLARHEEKQGMRLYHDRGRHIEGPVDSRDEEECYSSAGIRRGVFLTAELLRGPRVVTADIPVGQVTAFEVTGPGDAHRTFIVPSAVVTDFSFAAV